MLCSDGFSTSLAKDHGVLKSKTIELNHRLTEAPASPCVSSFSGPLLNLYVNSLSFLSVASKLKVNEGG